MKKVLQINETPFLHGYSHTASFMSIAMEKARFTKSDISVSDLKWKYESGYIQDFYCYTDDKTNETCSKKISRNVEKIGNCYDVFLGTL